MLFSHRIHHLFSILGSNVNNALLLSVYKFALLPLLGHNNVHIYRISHARSCFSFSFRSNDTTQFIILG